MRGVPAVAPGGDWFHGSAGCYRWSDGEGPANADPGWRGAGDQPRPADREARPGLGLAVAVPVHLDAAPDQADQDGVAVRRGEGGGQAGGGRTRRRR